MSFFTTSSGLYFPAHSLLPQKPPFSMSTDTVQEVDTTFSPEPRYRPALPIPDHTQEHCHIYLDEQLYSSALTLLSDLVVSSASHPESRARGVIAPSPFHIELVGCLLVHPRYTSQAPPDERAELASRSVTFLRNVLAILGPVNAHLDEAFSLVFDRTRTSRRSRITADVEDGTSGSESDEGSERMKGVIANTGRLRRCAKDFWHIVGWIFNCSVKHDKRWKYWKVWLGFMLDVIDADWKERDQLDQEDPVYQAKLRDDASTVCEFKLLRNSLLLQYLSEVQGRSGPSKRVVRAVFADGTPESLKEFPEVFANETREVRHTGHKRKRGEKFGDYGDDEDVEYDSSDLTDQASDPVDGSEDGDQDPWLGGTESVALRQRLTTLLSRVSHYLPDDFVHLRELYEAIYICVKPLPVPAFSLFISPSSHSYVFIEAYVSICQLLLLRLLPNNAPRPHSVSSKATDELSQEVFEKCLLPFPANTSSVIDNAKVSLLVESLLRLFIKSCECEPTAKFAAAVEKGILARESKVKGDKKRRDGGKAEDGDMLYLKASGMRLRLLIAWIKQSRQS